MASIDPSSISDIRKKNWVDEISKIFNHQLKIDVEAPNVAIFRVPEGITSEKPQAYEPQQIGLGPYHHFRPRLYEKMEHKKLAAMRRVLKNHNLKDFELSVLEKVRKLVPVVRECYDMFLQDDIEFLAWVFAMDGLFLLDLFRTYELEYENERDRLPSKKNAFDQYSTSSEEDMDLNDISIARIDGQTGKVVIKETVSDEIPSISGHKTEIEVTSDNQIEEIVDSNDISTMKVMDSDDLSPTLIGHETEKLVSAIQEKILLDLKEESRQRLRDSHNLYIFHDAVSFRKRPEVNWERRLLAQDMMMLENQIPFMVLKEINEALHEPSGDSFHSRNDFSPSIFRSFSEIHSPLELCSPSQAPADVQHLLQYMYHSIVNNVRMENKRMRYDHSLLGAAYLGLLPTIIRLCAKTFKFILKLPRDAIVQIYEQTVIILETFSQSKTIIPSASKLHKRAGFRFHQLWKDEGIQNIDLDINWKTIYLPHVTLNDDSEVILRNLVAYETSIVNTNNFPLTEFVALMCALMVNVNDVKLLQKEHIIEGGLEVDEVVKLFTSMRSSIPSITTKEKSELQKKIEEVNGVYESMLTMKIVFFFKKIANGLFVFLRAIGRVVEASWKIVAFVASIVTVSIVIWQAYCDVYGCDKTKDTLTFTHSSLARS